MTDIKVTQADMRQRKRYHKITGYIDMDLSLAKEIVRHRIEAQRPLLEAILTIEEQLDDMDEWIGEGGDFANQREAMRAAIKQAKGE